MQTYLSLKLSFKTILDGNIMYCTKHGNVHSLFVSSFIKNSFTKFTTPASLYANVNCSCIRFLWQKV